MGKKYAHCLGYCFVDSGRMPHHQLFPRYGNGGDEDGGNPHGACALWGIRAAGAGVPLHRGLRVDAEIDGSAIPGAGLVTLAMVLEQAGLPVEGIALILGVDRLLDMVRTVVNVTGNVVVTLIRGQGQGAVR
jgi:hypothetical protein